MIEYIEGDIFQSPAQVIVNAVNTVGVMGKGIALAFKKRYPDMFEKYRKICEKHQFTIGQLMLVYEPDHWILLFPTKENWRNPSRMDFLEKGLVKFINTYADKGISSIAFPKLGCGNGELDWQAVKPLMEKYLKPLPIDVYIYLGVNPEEPPEHREPEKMLEWLRKNAKDMSFNGVKDDIMTSTSLLPIQLDYQGVSYNVTYSGGVMFQDRASGENQFISENNFYRLWDELRSISIMRVDQTNLAASLTLALLADIGYLSKVRILNNKTGEMHDGYQVNEGRGRVYSIAEE